MADASRETALEGALLNLHERWWHDLKPKGWRAEKFRQMISPECQLYKGGVWAVRHLLYTRETTGFDRLRGRPDLTVEALVLSGEWDDIFDKHDKQAAQTKLASAHHPAPTPVDKRRAGSPT